MLQRGFALVDTPAFCDEDLSRRLKRRRTVLASDCARWWKLPQLARYACWLERLLDAALPEEALALAALDYRHEPAGYQDHEVDRLHADGGYVRTVCTLSGAPTVYRHQGEELPVPYGQTLLMTAQDRTRALRIPCTLHRRPGAGPERAVLVCSLVSRPDQPQPEGVYRRVASAVGTRGAS
jgi:hypothetical protein